MDKSKKYVSLQVTGNPDPNGGYRPIVLFNIVGEMIPVNENDYPGFSQNPFFFTFRIEDKRTLYTLVRNKVKSHGASRDGVSMKITISVPRGYRFESVAPYDVLVEMMDEFLQRAMTPIQGTGYYAYNSTRIEPTLLDDIARKYPLVASEDGPYRVMGSIGTAYMQLPDDKIRELLRDVHYPEFQAYREIVVAEHVDATPYTKLPPLDIPRQPAYTIYVDGFPQPGTVKDKDKPLTYQGSKDPHCYDNSSVTFTIGELLAGKGDPCVTIDKANEVVRVDTSRLSKAKVTTWTLRFTPEAATQYFLRNSDCLSVSLIIMGGGATRLLPLDSNLSFTLRGEEILGSFDVKVVKEDEYRKNGNLTTNQAGKDKFDVVVPVERIPRRPVTPSTQFQSGTSSNAQMPVSQDSKLTITFAEGNPFGIGKDNRRKTFKLIMSDGSEYVTEVEFCQQLGANKKPKASGKQWIGKISIPSSLVGSVKCIRFDCGKSSYAEASVWSNTTEVDGSAFGKPKSVGLLNLKFGFLQLVLMLLIALVVGFAAGCLTGGLAGWSFGDEGMGVETVSETPSGAPPAVGHQAELTEEDSVSFTNESNGGADKETTVTDDNKYGSGIREETNPTTEETVYENTTKESKYTCTVPVKGRQCGATFDSKDKLWEHQVEAHDHYFCKECGQDEWWKSQRELDAHMRDKHPDKL